MDEEMKTRLAESMDKVLGYVEQGADFAVEQAPLVAQEIVYWGIAEGVLVTALAIAFLVGGGFVIRKLVGAAGSEHRKPIYEQNDAVLFGSFMGSIAFGVAAIVAVLTACEGILQATKAIVSPRLYILERIGELL